MTKGCHFADIIFKYIFSNGNVWILIKMLLKIVAKGPVNNIPDNDLALTRQQVII